ncbi:MAG: DUF2158 domain-containing protein [Bacteroidota bacterium]
MDLKTGDIVMLKSGGPEMTILRVIGETENNRMDEAMRMRGYDDGDVLCDWESENSTTRPRKVFKAVMLMDPNVVEEVEEEITEDDEAVADDVDSSEDSAEEEDFDFDDDDFDF